MIFFLKITNISCLFSQLTINLLGYAIGKSSKHKLQSGKHVAMPALPCPYKPIYFQPHQEVVAACYLVMHAKRCRHVVARQTGAALSGNPNYC